MNQLVFKFFVILAVAGLLHWLERGPVHQKVVDSILEGVAYTDN